MNNPYNISNKTKIGMEALLTGAKHIVNLFGKEIYDIGVEYKPESGDTPRTLIDKNSERDITSIIRSYSEFKEDLINGEEEGITGTQSERIWYIDPYDGTSNAQIKLPMSTSGIGIYQNNKFVSSIILNPFENKIYVAETGKGAHMASIVFNGNKFNVLEDTWKTLKTDTSSDQKSKYAWVDSLFNNNTTKRKTNWINQMQKNNMMQNIRMTGSNIDYSTKLAEGRGHYQLTDAIGGYFDLAGACLIEEAGGIITNIEGNYPCPKDKIVVAVSNPKDLEKVLNITQSCYKNYKGYNFKERTLRVDKGPLEYLK
jgi:myo-inositol-1(or 4)-monophosphatase